MNLNWTLARNGLKYFIYIYKVYVCKIYELISKSGGFREVTGVNSHQYPPSPDEKIEKKIVPILEVEVFFVKHV